MIAEGAAGAGLPSPTAGAALPVSCRALALLGPAEVGFAAHAVRAPREHEVLVRVHACGICGSDLRWYREGRREASFLGHEFSGTVVATGPGVDDFRAGDRIAASLARGCGTCEACVRGFPNFCPRSRDQFAPGGFAEYTLVDVGGGFRPIARIPAALDDVRASLLEPLACALRIARRAQVAAGARILVLGLGTMGTLAGLLLRQDVAGSFVVGADTNPTRVDLARALGFDAAVHLRGSPADSLRAVTPSYDLVIDATGVAATFPLAVDLAGLGATVILGGVPVDRVDFAPLPIFRKELTVVGAKGPFPFDGSDGLPGTLDVLASPRLPWERLVGALPFGEAAEGFRRAARGADIKTVLTFS